MASAAFSMDVIEDQSGGHGHEDDKGPLIKHYKVSALIPPPTLPMHKLMKREPAMWAAVQISSGVLSIGIGVMFAVSFEINDMFLTLFRVPIVSGIMFLVAGFLSTLLYRQPSLLQTCFQSNIFCLAVATSGAVLLCLDLIKPVAPLQHQVEIMVLCVTLLDMLVSSVLIKLIHAEKSRQRKK